MTDNGRPNIAQTKVSDQELKLIKAAAKAQDTTVAALLRDAVLAYVGAPGEGPSFVSRIEKLEGQVRELAKRGKTT
jgi:hypothetical protein